MGLLRVETRGVVVLFNAIRSAQKSVEAEAETSGGVKWIVEPEVGSDRLVRRGKEMIKEQGAERRENEARLLRPRRWAWIWRC
jgi:ribose 1,5-bisphosphokinase PhnN